MKVKTTTMIAAGLALGLLSSCEIQRAARVGAVTRERATECEQVCANLGMRMSAMVVMMNSAGCVCEPPAARASATAGGASAAAGGTTIAAAAAALQVQQQQQQQQQQQHTP
jgi:hypothetical protein